MRVHIFVIMKIIDAQLESGQEVTNPADLGVWRLTLVGTYIANRSDVEEAGGSRRVCLPSSTLRVADFEWEPVRDWVGKVIAWRRSINGTACFILNTPPEKKNQMTKKKRDHGTAENPNPVSYTLPEPAAEAPKVKTPRALDFLPQDSVKVSRLGTKVAILVDLLSREQGATLGEVAEALSVTGSKVDSAIARSWISFDLKGPRYRGKTVDGRTHLPLHDWVNSPPS